MAFLQRKSAAKVVAFRSQIQTPSPYSIAYQDFVQNTSLLGVQQFLRKKSFIWLLAYLICVVMSLLQSWSVTVTFFQQKTFHTVTMASKSPLPFPSVTVCTNTVLRDNFNFSLIPGFDVEIHERLLKECDDGDAMNEMKKAMLNNTAATRYFMRSLSDEERFALGLNLSKVVKSCKFHYKHCNFSDPNEVYIYSDPVFGTCFTFNPAFNDDIAKQSNPEDYLYLRLKFPSKGYWVTSRSRAKLAVKIHPPGTTPLLESPDVKDIFTDEKVTLAVDLESELLSLKKRTSGIPSCVDNDNEKYRRRNIHYSDSSPYKYSQEACLKTCQEEAFSECNLTYMYTPVKSREYEQNKTISLYSEDCKLKPVTMEACNCPIPCQKVKYGIIRDDNEMFNVPCEHEDASSPTPTKKPMKKKAADSDYDNEARITVTFISNIYQRIDEELCYGLSEYLGILGGNMSLWIGLCVLSVLEVVELVIRLIIASLKGQQKPKTNYVPTFSAQRRLEHRKPPKTLHF